MTAQPFATDRYQDPRSVEWAAKNSRPAEQLGRVFDLDGALAKFGRESIQPLLDGCLTADDLGRAVVEDLTALGRPGWRMLDQALDEGIDAVDAPPASLVTLFRQLDNPPEWVDWDQLRRGSFAYFRSGLLVFFALILRAVGGAYYVYGISRSLNFTGRLDKMAYMRAKETTRWLLAANRPDGMRRDREGFKLSVKVRLLHAMARRGLSRSRQWDWDDWGMPICHTDGLYVISYTATTAVIDALSEVGVRFSAQEVEDIYALWRYVGWIQGLPDQLLHRDAAQGRRFSEIYLALDPGADDDCRSLLRSWIEQTTPEDPDKALELLPKYLAPLLPPARLRKVLYGFSRYWVGDEAADYLKIPDTFYKHLPKAVRVGVRLREATRRVLPTNDEKACYRTLRVLDNAVDVRPGESVLVPTTEVVDAIGARGPSFSGSRGRRHGAARR